MLSSLFFRANPLSLVKSNSRWFLTICRACSTSAKVLFLDQSRTSIGLTPAFIIAGADICTLFSQAERNPESHRPWYVPIWEYCLASEPFTFRIQTSHLLVLFSLGIVERELNCFPIIVTAQKHYIFYSWNVHKCIPSPSSNFGQNEIIKLSSLHWEYEML